MEDQPRQASVPSQIMSPADVVRLRREVAVLDDYLAQEALRTPGQPQARLPRLSRLLDELVTANHLNLLDKTTRQRLMAFLDRLASNAPVVTISFASDPSPQFMQQIVAWFRKNVHPSMLVRIGLQPNLGAGCMLRTTNKFFDLSVRQTLKKRQPELITAIKSGGRQ